MKRTHLMLLMIINVALILFYMGLSYYDGYYNLPLGLGLAYYRYIAISGSIVNIIALLVMWVRGVNRRKAIMVFSIFIAICILCFILSLPTYSFLFLLPMSALFVFLYSMIFQVFVFFLDSILETKDYNYVAYLLLPVLVWCFFASIFMSNIVG